MKRRLLAALLSIVLLSGCGQYAGQSKCVKNPEVGGFAALPSERLWKLNHHYQICQGEASDLIMGDEILDELARRGDAKAMYERWMSYADETGWTSDKPFSPQASALLRRSAELGNARAKEDLKSYANRLR